MLKSLELFGFKSFADRTRFDFARGITCVVGPNGSGKSNVVDAIKWILGDQSPKSLRGKEMTDVIFNGASGRKPSAFAEATLTFDNCDGRLPIDSQEVQIGRRIWRNGDAEYLINRSPARLKDVRDLFMGTGAATSAYSIIEQGRVDQILQANANARRMVFEEAAGISRYKARKTDALRKLERVAQNLLRLTDIVDEVEAQLNATRSQAAKAAKYREVSGELRELWLGLAADDYRHLSAGLDEIKQQTAEFDRRMVELNEQQRGYEERLTALDVEIAEVDDRLREVERRSADSRETIASHESTIRHQSARQCELEADLQRLRRQRRIMTARVEEVDAEVGDVRRQLESFDHEFRRQQQQLALRDEEIRALTETLDAGTQFIEQDRRRVLDLMQRVSGFNNRLASLETQRESLAAAREKTATAAEELVVAIEDCESECRRRQAVVDEKRAEASQADIELREFEEQRRALAEKHEAYQRRLSEQREQRSAWEARKNVLEDLERRQEGLGIGVREILSRARTSNYPPWNRILGSVADLFEAELEDAALLEVALGSRSQLIVISECGPLFEYLSLGASTISGRVGFIAANPDDPAVDSRVYRPNSGRDFSGLDGVVKRADQLVKSAGTVSDLPVRLLADTWIVTTLDVARELARGDGCGCRFVTLQGELLETDGTLYVGTVRGETALVSRKSELRRLKSDLLRLEHRIQNEQQELLVLDDSLRVVERECEAAESRRQTFADQLVKLTADADSHRRELARLQAEQTEVQEELSRLQVQLEQIQNEVASVQGAVEAAENEAEALQQQIEERRNTQSEAEQHLQDLKQNQADERLGIAKQEERLAGLNAAQERLTAEGRQRRQQLDEAERRYDVAVETLRKVILQILNTSAILAELALDEEHLARDVSGLLAERRAVRDRRAQLVAEETKTRQLRRDLSEQKHAREMEIRDITHQIATFEARIEEEYQLTLEEVVASGASAFRQYLLERQGIPKDSPPAAEDAAGDIYADAPAEAAESGAEQTEAEGIPSDDVREIRSADEIDPAMNIRFEDVREELEARVNRLRRKLKMMGSINTDSLDSLEELETRYKHLSEQLQDLVEAKSTLEEIVRKINVESKRLFLESFEAIRTHFQELFRKLFGGGEGDIILEDTDEVLECGIDVVARPPGKELRSITLLSGGEKTMTAVALLMAIFKSRPSPFCILDEVDAALDEANIERYSSVVKEFEETTQFIMITHSKRSMTVADVLYGVTMEQSGVSKRMSVRFEDVSENGDIRTEAGSDGDVSSSAMGEAA